MNQCQTFTVILCHDRFAMPAFAWWASGYADGSDDDVCLMTTALHACPIDVLIEVAHRLGRILEAATSQKEEAR